jgi:DNA invertase Pin-like site-specific DNA recombinase
VVAVPTSNWRARVDAADQRRSELQAELSEVARQRAAALEDGAEELGSKSAVARELGINVSAVRKYIREHGRATATPAGSPETTE